MTDYEKKYNEALKWMRELYPGLHGATKEDAEHYFPELRESEDERVRKAIISLVHENSSVYKSFAGIDLCDMLAWLEKQKEQVMDETDKIAAAYQLGRSDERKQKEQKPAEWDELQADFRNINEAFEDGKKEVLAHPGKYGLCKPAEWSEEDEKMIWNIISIVGHSRSGQAEEMIDWLKSLRSTK